MYIYTLYTYIYNNIDSIVCVMYYRLFIFLKSLLMDVLKFIAIKPSAHLRRCARMSESLSFR